MTLPPFSPFAALRYLMEMAQAAEAEDLASCYTIKPSCHMAINRQKAVRMAPLFYMDV